MSISHSLLFIPDISGFTNFVQHTEIEHSKHIIGELLELLIDANELGLTLAEIEGDALFFYKEELPSREAILHQVERMFIKFHEYLLAYKYRRICRCGACTTAADLNLKFVIHAGEIDFVEVKEMRKPFGHNVVLAHRLLKNNVIADEYALFSDSAHASIPSSPEVAVSISGEPLPGETTYDLGTEKYFFYQLKPLQQLIDVPPLNEPGERISNPWKIEMNIAAPVEAVYELISSFERRLEWNNGVSEIKYKKGQVNRVGSKHKCVVNDKLINFETITADFGGKLVYGERTQEVPVIDGLNSYFIMEPRGKKETMLTIEIHPFTLSPIKKLFVPVLKLLAWKKLKDQFSLIKKVAETSPF